MSSSFQIRNELASGFQSVNGMAGVLNAVSSSSSSGASMADYIVSPDSEYKTIGAALDAASAHTSSVQTIYVTAGTYNESILIPDNIILMGPNSYPPVVTITGITTISNNITRLQNLTITNLSCNPTISSPDVACASCTFTNIVSLPSTQAQTTTSLRFYNCIFKGTSVGIGLACEFDGCRISTTNFTISGSAVNTAPILANFFRCIATTTINIVGNLPVTNVSFFMTVIATANTIGLNLNTGIVTFLMDTDEEGLSSPAIAGVAAVSMIDSTIISGTSMCVLCSNTATIVGTNNMFSSTNTNILSGGITYTTNETTINSIITKGAISAIGNISSQGTITSGTNVINSFVIAAPSVVYVPLPSNPVTFTVGGVTGFWQTFSPQRGSQNIVLNNTTGLFQNVGPSAYYNVSATVNYYNSAINGQAANGIYEFYLNAGLSPTAVALNTAPVIGSTLVAQTFSIKNGLSWYGHDPHTLNFTMYFPANSYFWLSGTVNTATGSALTGQLTLADNLNNYQSSLVFTQIP